MDKKVKIGIGLIVLVIVVIGIFLSFMATCCGPSDYEITDLVQSKSIIIEEVLTDDSVCSSKVIELPGTLRDGDSHLFYDMGFSKHVLDDSKNVLEISINVKNSDDILDSRSIYTSAEILLVDPQHLLDDFNLGAYFHLEDGYSIKLYPGGGITDSFIVLKSTFEGTDTLYIVPCSSSVDGGCSQMVCSD